MSLTVTHFAATEGKNFKRTNPVWEYRPRITISGSQSMSQNMAVGDRFILGDALAKRSRRQIVVDRRWMRNTDMQAQKKRQVESRVQWRNENVWQPWPKTRHSTDGAATPPITTIHWPFTRRPLWSNTLTVDRKPWRHRAGWQAWYVLQSGVYWPLSVPRSSSPFDLYFGPLLPYQHSGTFPGCSQITDQLN